MVKASEVLKQHIGIVNAELKEATRSIKVCKASILPLRVQRKALSEKLGVLKRQVRQANREGTGALVSKLSLQVNAVRNYLHEVDYNIQQNKYILSEFYKSGGFVQFQEHIQVLDGLMEAEKAKEVIDDAAAGAPVVVDTSEQARAVAEAHAAS